PITVRKPTAQSWPELVAAIPVSPNCPPDHVGRQLVPPSVVRRIVPPSPTIQATLADTAVTARRSATLPDTCRRQVRPPSTVARIVPPLPTAQAICGVGAATP